MWLIFISRRQYWVYNRGGHLIIMKWGNNFGVNNSNI